MEKKKMFLEKTEWEEAMKADYFLKDHAVAVEHENAMVLPLIRTEKSKGKVSSTYAGGVCGSDGTFLAGLSRDKNNLNYNYTCQETYPVKKQDVKHRDETVVFGGILFKAFGHTFLDSLSRLWWAADNRENDYKYVFVRIPTQDVWCFEFFHLLGIPMDRIEIIEAPTIFKKVIVPDEAIHSWTGYKEEYSRIFDSIRDSVEPSNYEKIYLTRSKQESPDCINEEYFEGFYKKRGFEIIAPEQHTIKEQISILAGAKEVVCTVGTLSHLVLFCQNGVKLTILNRTNDKVLIPQAIINQVRKVDCNMIDVSANFLPTFHVRGCFLIGPTKYWIEYLKEHEIDITEEEAQFDYDKKALQYLLAWCKNYSVKLNYCLIEKMDMFNVVNEMHKVFYGTALERKKIENKNIPSKELLLKENAKLKKEIDTLKNKICEMEYSAVSQIKVDDKRGVKKYLNMMIGRNK